MAQLIIEVDDEIGLVEIKNMFRRFLKLKEKEIDRNALKFKERQDFVNDFKYSLHEVELHQLDKTKLPSFEDMINEL